MTKDSQQIASRIVATRGVREYRATIDDLVSDRDVVLEIGCEWGTTTALLAQRAARVVGTDISAVCIERGLVDHPGSTACARCIRPRRGVAPRSVGKF